VRNLKDASFDEHPSIPPPEARTIDGETTLAIRTSLIINPETEFRRSKLAHEAVGARKQILWARGY
jgi:hypothetical protein